MHHLHPDPQTQIQSYIDSLTEPRRTDMQTLHQHIMRILPKGPLWYLDGKDETAKVVSNPNIGYGQYTLRYNDGPTKPFYQIGISANATGMSVYVMGPDDKTALPEKFGPLIRKAKVTGYCIKFKTLHDINLDHLTEAIRYGLNDAAIS